MQSHTPVPNEEIATALLKFYISIHKKNDKYICDPPLEIGALYMVRGLGPTMRENASVFFLPKIH